MKVDIFQSSDEVRVVGELTFETVAELLKKILSLPSKAFSKINLAEVTEVNSAALGLCLELKRRVIEQKTLITFTHVPERLISLAEVYGVKAWLFSESLD